MSGVFSMASHWALQYLPDVVTQEQTGCAHFSAFTLTLASPGFGSTASDTGRYFKTMERSISVH
jgi:hypothetical protein